MMQPDIFYAGLIMSTWAVAMGAWVGAIDQPFRLCECLRWAAAFGMLSVALCVVNGVILC
jgi:hypothetical protein